MLNYACDHVLNSSCDHMLNYSCDHMLNYACDHLLNYSCGHLLNCVSDHMLNSRCDHVYYYLSHHQTDNYVSEWISHIYSYSSGDPDLAVFDVSDCYSKKEKMDINFQMKGKNFANLINVVNVPELCVAERPVTFITTRILKGTLFSNTGRKIVSSLTYLHLKNTIPLYFQFQVRIRT